MEGVVLECVDIRHHTGVALGQAVSELSRVKVAVRVTLPRYITREIFNDLAQN